MAEYTITIQRGEGSTDTPQEIRDKLETLSGTDRLHAAAIQGLAGSVTGDEVVALLEAQPTTPTDTRLDASAIKNLPTATHPDAAAHRTLLETLSGNDRLSGLKVNLAGAGLEMVTALSALTGANQLSLTKLKDRTKAVIAGCERALNYRGMGNVIGSQGWRNQYMTYIRVGDFWIQSDPSTAIGTGDNISGPPPGGGTIINPSSLCLNGDWFIALMDSTGAPTQPNFWYVEQWLRLPFGQLYSTFNWPAWAGTAKDTKTGEPNPLIQKTDELGVSFYGSGSVANGLASLALGIYNKTEAGADLSLTHGNGSKAVNYAERSMAATMMNNPGDLQSSSFMLYHTSSNNSPQIVSTPQNPVLAPISSNVVEIEGTASSEDATVMAHFIKKYLIAVDHTNTITATLISGSQTNIGTDADDMTIDVVPTVATESGNPVTRLNLTATGLSYTSIVWNFRVNHIQTVFEYNIT